MKKITLIEVTGPSCGVCKMIKSMVEKAVSKFTPEQLEYREVCVKDAESEEFAAKHSIRSVPVFLFFEGEELVHRIDGAVNFVSLKEKIEELLNK